MTTRTYPRTAHGVDAAWRTARYADPITVPSDPIYARPSSAHFVSRRDTVLGIVVAIIIGIVGAAAVFFNLSA